ncbi:FAD-binding oxidoreductase (plasmid) [Streptomyces sp. NBC_00868]|uniref:NAD(P)/FAD-dependent oxidoreductase n=1 Tax=Streptomyces sp. NBC_00868 TaxID=2903683 RepID=UPI00386A4F8D|nr:FAD-binding oxidoreductase [Streptomyces sp. NBC_00868]
MGRVSAMGVSGVDVSGVDVAVIGAGIVGCMTAREVLDRWPGASVAVVEGDAVGSGASRRSAGLHFPRGASTRVREMAGVSELRYRALRAELPGLPVYDVDTTVIAPGNADGRLRQVYLPGAGLRRTDVVPEVLNGLPEGDGAWQVSGGQYADVQGVAQALAAALRPEVRFLEGTRVTGMVSGSDGVELDLSSGGTLRAAKVLLAPGPWVADPAWASWLEPLGLRVKKVVALHVERRPSPGDGVVVFEDEDAFLLPVHHRGHWLFSYTCRQWDVLPEQVPGHLTPVEIAEAHAALARFAPELLPLSTTGRVFCDAYSPDRAPVVRAVDPHSNVVFAGAANGSGYRLAPAIAAEAAALLGPLHSSSTVPPRTVASRSFT